MKLLRTTPEQVVFLLGNREKELLLSVLRLYPRIPPAHQQLSKNPERLPDREGGQRLLAESLAEQRAEQQKRLRLLIEDRRRLSATQSGWELALSPGELEWLLQVLNDIRVGSWLAAGSPEDLLGRITERTAPHIWAMEVSGSFQMGLLHMLEGEQPA
ncbi:MAG TPA: hypothetical protein VG167_18385 [Verrucomicrobiae bacterium]|nr:hypothetical protein [Verrucomicrobiae bacterium]